MKRLWRYFLYREAFRWLSGAGKDQESSGDQRGSAHTPMDDLDTTSLPADGEAFESPEQLLAVLQQMDPYAFEYLVADLWEEMGWTTEVPSQGSDEGVDVIARKAVPYDQTVLIQTKRYGPTTTVGSPEIQQYASLRHQYEGIDKVVMVTTNTFTQPAENLAERLNVKRIDGNDLIELLLGFDAIDLVAEHCQFVSRRDETDGVDPEPDVVTERGEDTQTPATEATTTPLTIETPFSKYYYGVAIACVLWIVYVPGVSIAEAPAVMVLGFPAWIILPVCLYLDTEAIDQDWPDHRWVYLGVALFPVFAVISGLVYLWKRHRLTELTHR